LRQQVRRRVAQPIQRAIGVVIHLAHRGELYLRRTVGGSILKVGMSKA
jgi:hypothetical protein